MKHFDYITAAKGLLTPQTTTLLSAIHEAKGRTKRTGCNQA